MSDMSGPARRKLTIALTIVFFLAMVMGCGPGLYLINPIPAEPGAMATVFGAPVIFAWALFWCLVQAGVVLVAYQRLWDG